MRTRRQLLILCSAAALAGCAAAPSPPATPAPPACQLASFHAAPGQELVRPAGRRGTRPDGAAFALDRSIADTGAWVDAAPGWRAWRYWLRSETARSVAVHLKPFELPPGAEFWLCSPDRTTRKGPVTGKGFGDVGAYRSPEVVGPELWLEVLAPAGAERDVTLVILEAFAAPP